MGCFKVESKAFAGEGCTGEGLEGDVDRVRRGAVSRVFGSDVHGAVVLAGFEDAGKLVRG